MRRRGLAPVALGFACLALVGCGAAPPPPPISLQRLRVALAGSPVPLARLHAQQGQVLRVSAAGLRAQLVALRGYPIAIVGWGSWCPPCRAEFPYLQRAMLRFGRRVAFVGLDVFDAPARARAFLRRVPVPFPSYGDPESALLRSFGGIGGVPTTVFLDRAGRVSFVHQGAFRSTADVEHALRRYALDA